MLMTLMMVAGLFGLYFGAEWLVRGGAAMAIRLGMTPLLAGLTVVAFGTSTPELIVSLTAAAQGQGAMAVGNAIGSNILNVGVILGLTAVICPLRVQYQLLRFDTPVMIGVSGLFLVFFRDRQIQSIEAWAFLAVLAVYMLLNVWMARRKADPAVEEEYAESVPAPQGPPWIDGGLLLAGLALLTLGSRLFVTGAVDLARLLGVSEAVIGLTIVAGGTSLPELASSLVAAWRKQPDIAIGNIVGSNIFNLLAILGLAGVVASPLDGQGVSLTDTLVMFGISAVLGIIAWTGFQLKRWEGAMLLTIYAGYLWHLWPMS